LIAVTVSACGAAHAGAPAAAPPRVAAQRARAALLAEASLDELQAALARGDFTAEDLTTAALERIDALDRKGPVLSAVLATSPDAVAEARASDAARRAGAKGGPLAGIPVLVKDNIETRGLPTTAGSLALRENVPQTDAPAVARLRAAGAIIVGKTNLSEWANVRSEHSVSGWSAIGGLVKNPYALARNACGSSSGSGAAVASAMAPVALGTETSGSVVCPSSVNGLVGLKPTVGLVSRRGVVPVSHTQDTIGPMGRSVRDVAELLTVLAGTDPSDPATAEADARRVDYAAQLSDSPDALRGLRVGVLVDELGHHPATLAVFQAALQTLRGAGATVVDVPDSKIDGIGPAEETVLLTELAADLTRYLAASPPAVKTRSLKDLIQFDADHASAELAWFGQEIFEKAVASPGPSDPKYVEALAAVHEGAARRIDDLLGKHGVSLLVAPTMSPAWLSDPINGDQFDGPSATGLPAMAGYPHLTVPMGAVSGLPVGLSLIGPKWSEAALLRAGYAFERLTKARRPPPL
jgi:amidase